MLEELVETQAEVAAKARQLAEWIAAAKHCVVFTGAGIAQGSLFQSGVCVWRVPPDSVPFDPTWCFDLLLLGFF